MPRFRTGPLAAALGILLLGSAVALPQTAVAQTSGPDPLGADAHWAAFRSDVLSPGFFFRSVGSATGSHLDDDPGAWGENIGGYAARVGSSTGESLLQTGTMHGLAAALDLDIRPCLRRHSGLGARLRHAVLSPFIARTPTDARVPNVPNIAATYGGALAQARWERGRWTPGRALRSTGVSLGIDVVINLFREFLGTPLSRD
ncbi:hypothetical protein [Salinibacter grassmerensis]|uniref:hypothetical protein n=1 Tax=Salinibacter grassmerensis TaxID=3040353 RepID=UPI0021E884CF|nr:hypothetical protein [Salinibacter grassmerensis]